MTPLDTRNAAIVSLGRAGMHVDAHRLASYSPTRPGESTTLGLLTGVAWRNAITLAERQSDPKRERQFRDVADDLARLMHALVWTLGCRAAA